MIALAAMQGYGKPGSNIWGTAQGAPSDEQFFFPGYAEGGISGDVDNSAAGYQLRLPVFANTRGATRTAHHSTEGQTVPRHPYPRSHDAREGGVARQGLLRVVHRDRSSRSTTYPAPGYPHVQMYWKYGGSFIGTMTETNRYVKAYREGKVGIVVNQSIWFEGEARFADIILPACTNFERWDISEFANCSGYIPHTGTQTNHRMIVLQKKCIEPLGESKSDYEIFALFAERLGIGEIFTMGGKDEYSTGSRTTSTPPTCPRSSPGRSSRRRATRHARPRRTTSPRRPCAGSRKAAQRHA